MSVELYMGWNSELMDSLPVLYFCNECRQVITIHMMALDPKKQSWRSEVSSSKKTLKRSKPDLSQSLGRKLQLPWSQMHPANSQVEDLTQKPFVKGSQVATTQQTLRLQTPSAHLPNDPSQEGEHMTMFLEEKELLETQQNQDLEVDWQISFDRAISSAASSFPSIGEGYSARWGFFFQTRGD
ncbi:uncharacterized protein LOC115031515 isoform X2 [Mus caroli]|uniref:Uncharacterized protein LOC115031515 isoform X2 n=1 Tax=Mus caroli TaxID=10089 RepID=A0A6P7R3T1_MUSCR|nr:uncharacterized protein LOC115031515 isoform X2 [Mus caroli]